MALVSLQNVSVGFGGPLLLEEVDLSIDRGERWREDLLQLRERLHRWV